MGTWRALAMLATAALVGVALSAGTALAGGWAVTYLDPLPDRFEAGRGYTVGFWVLQHGSHAYQGDLGETGLTLVDERGVATRFAGVRLPEPAHYAAAIAVPHAGRYEVIAAQGLFAPYPVGILTVPGRLTIAPTPTPLALHDNHSDGWAAIRPPIASTPSAADTAKADAPAAAASDGGVDSAGTWPVAATVAVAAAFAALALFARRPLTSATRSVRRRLPWRPATRRP